MFTRLKNKDDRVQIDLMIDSDVNVTNLCEIKYYNAPFTMDKKYSEELINKIQIIC